MIQIRGLTVKYGDFIALEDISLDVKQAEWILISGPSGCGKSTLARAICGIIPQYIPAQISGSIRVASLDPCSQPLPVIAQQVGIVFQNPGSQLFHLRVEDEVAFGPRNLGLCEREVQDRTNWALEATGLEKLRDCKPAELSGGQKQCVAIAAMLVMRPQVLVLDEPTASLDIPSTYKVLETLSVLKDRFGITILMIEHRLAAPMNHVDRVLLMDDGKIVADGSPEKVLGDRSRRESFGLRRLVEQPMTPWNELIQHNGKRNPEKLPLLRLEGLSAGYNKRDVIKDIELEIYPGDFLALVGDNGAGKSTLALVVAGLLKPHRGHLRFGGNKRPKPGLDVALLFQNPTVQLFTNSVEEEVAFASYNYGCFNAEIHLHTLEEADLLTFRNRRPATLSIGQQQRCALAACLALRPRLVILDEPTLGQDWGHLQQLMDFTRQLNERETAVLLITHDYKLVHHYANRIILMEEGRIKLFGSLKKTKQKELSHEI